MNDAVSERLAVVGSCVVLLALGLAGVSLCRQIGVLHGGLVIPLAWYLFPTLLAGLVVVAAVCLPATVLRWRRGAVLWALILVALLAGATVPLLYVVCDFERHLSQSGASKPVERPESHAAGTRA